MEIKLPTYLRVAVTLLGLVLTIYLLDEWKDVLVPIVFGVLLAFLLLPTNRWLEKLRIPRPFAIILSLLMVIVIFGGLIWFLSSQLLSFRAEMGSLGDRLDILFARFQEFMWLRFKVMPSSRSEMIEETIEHIQKKGASYLGDTLGYTAEMLTKVALVPIYVFCLLYYRNHFRQFMYLFVRDDQRTNMMQVVDTIQKVVQSYLTGLVIVIALVSMLNSTGLLMLGLPYGLFFGIFGSLLIVIPYVGIMIGATLPAIYALILTGSLSMSLGVVAIFSTVQFFEANWITPYIIGSRVRLNAMAAIIGLAIGGEIWGGVGMVLAIPVTAIIKVIMDSYPPLNPFGFLLADITPTEEGNMFTGAWRKVSGFFKRKA